ncbi:hypothetical protein IG631_08590 [Alternaria alternata]|nr:hypothetical protein IG631_08590 [Alternaria alternata]
MQPQSGQRRAYYGCASPLLFRHRPCTRVNQHSAIASLNDICLDTECVRVLGVLEGAGINKPRFELHRTSL